MNAHEIPQEKEKKSIVTEDEGGWGRDALRQALCRIILRLRFINLLFGQVGFVITGAFLESNMPNHDVRVHCLSCTGIARTDTSRRLWREVPLLPPGHCLGAPWSVQWKFTISWLQVPFYNGEKKPVVPLPFSKKASSLNDCTLWPFNVNNLGFSQHIWKVIIFKNVAPFESTLFALDMFDWSFQTLSIRLPATLTNWQLSILAMHTSFSLTMVSQATNNA